MLDVKTLTIDQKLKLLTGANLWQNDSVDGKLYQVRMADGPNGLRLSDFDDANPQDETAFPSLAVAGSSWDREIIKEMADAIADEAIEEKVDLVLGPGINIKRSPYCGRNFEYISEDPYFSGEMGKAYIDAMQKRGIGTSLKHFAVNNSEWDRCYQSSEVSERAMQEIYFAGFKKAIDANPWTIMCSYNPVNGVYAAENRKLLKLTLRDKFGYKGVVVSDWGAVLNSYKSLKAGLDMRMPYHEDGFTTLKSAYKKGLITDSEIDESAQRVIDLAEKAQNAKKHHKINMTRAERHQKAVEIAQSGMVLLKNEDDILPLKGGKIVVSGTYTVNPPLAGNGAAMVKTAYKQTELDKLLAQALPDANVEYVDVVNGIRLRAIRMRHLVERAYGSDVTIIAVGNTNVEEGESWDRENLRICPLDEKLILETAKKCDNVVVLLYTGSSIDCSSWIDSVKACLWVGFSGEGVNEAITNILTGKVNPSGKLTETFPIEDNVYPDSNEGNGFVTRYGDDVFVGYRMYDTFGVDVCFPFGHGLSYSEFEYSDLDINKLSETDYEISFKVKNISNIDGAEVCQVYVKDVVSMVSRPQKELKGFDKVYLKAGEQKTVKVVLDRSSFAYWSDPLDEFYVENGVFEILVGASSRDIRLNGKIKINLPDELQVSK